jgi:16S rRNA pseudouridine516 synthase
MTASQRLDRLLANLGYGSRREAQRLIASGEVLLDGAPLADPAAHIAIAPDLSARMRVAGAPLDPPAPLNLLLHKPLGAVCSHREAGRSIYERLPGRWRARTPALSSVGRLDAETSGLILLTDDGALLHRIISPKRHVAKRYLARLARPLAGGEAALFASGTLVLEGETKPLLPASLEPIDRRTAHITVFEGRYHQVRRMFAAAGNHVENLHRDRIGALDLPADLAPGAFRVLSDADLAALFADV